MIDDDFRAEMDELRARMAELEARLERPGGPLTGPAANGRTPTTRRSLLRMAGAALIGAAGATAASAIPAAATSGNPMLLGRANDADAITSLTSTSGTAPTTLFEAQVAHGGLPTSQQGMNGAIIGVGALSAPNDGVDGYAAGALGYGVLGQSDAGYGVVGATDTGVDIAAIGTGRLQQRGTVAAGAPGYLPTAGRFELVRDSAGVVWASGLTLSAWRRLTTLELFPNPRRVYGDGSMTAAGNISAAIDATQQVSAGGASGVPAGASAAWCAVMSYQPGVMTLFPAGTAPPVAGNWGAQAPYNPSGGVQMLYMFVPLNSLGKFQIRNDFTSKQIFVDAWGYTL